ncbi:MAG TPA: hypothetical protein PLJ78_10875 [Anaerolineae bacterium]|nr:hypothetical protein [Anaerolineae bacterium]HQK14430.1 hypothetical protein [Anaerolineae bacterium]
MARLLGAVLRGVPCSRCFSADARSCVAALRPPLRVYGQEHIPTRGPCLLTINHYSRPATEDAASFRAWWLALGVSAVVPAEVHWVVTEAWTYPDPLRAHLITPATRWLFRRVARVYGFTAMPPMPPDPRDVVARAVAVRHLLAYADTTPAPLIGLAPEGGDAPGGVLQAPPSGVGRLILHLVRMGLSITPVGAFEADGAFCLRFGPAYRLETPAATSPDERDRIASTLVMRHIAAQLPEPLRGEF